MLHYKKKQNPVFCSVALYAPFVYTAIVSLCLDQFEAAVEEEDYDILTHPVMKELTKQKWNTYVR